jgi:transposase-like protein
MKIPIRHQIQEGETILSWLARWKSIGGFYDEEDMLFHLIGKRRVRFHPYIPHSLGLIANNIKVPVNSLLINHTLFPLFRLFNWGNSQELANAMILEGCGSPTSISTISTIKNTFYNGHKFCPACVRQDREKLGFGYFRIKHQIPGVVACDEHCCLLHAIQGGDLGYDRKLFNPPKVSSFEPASTAQIEFSLYASKNINLSKQLNSEIDYQDIYLQHLFDKGFVTQNGSLRIKKLFNELTTQINEKEFVGELGIPKYFFDFKFIGPLLRRKTHFPCHPTKHLLFSFWLFNGDANALITPFIKKEKSPTIDNSANKKAVEDQTVKLLKRGLSMEKISGIVNKSRCYVRRIAELHSIEHVSNANSYKLRIKNRVLLLATLGRHRKTISKQLKVGIGYVEQVISNAKGLVAWRKKLKEYKKVQLAMGELKKARNEHPDWRRKELKSHCNQAFFYLYHHNRKLLEKIIPKKTKPTANNAKSHHK